MIVGLNWWPPITSLALPRVVWVGFAVSVELFAVWWLGVEVGLLGARWPRASRRGAASVEAAVEREFAIFVEALGALLLSLVLGACLGEISSLLPFSLLPLG